MTARRFKVLLEWDAEDDCWVSYVPALNHLSTFGETLDDVLERTREAILGHMEAARIEGIALPVREPALELLALEIAGA